MLVKLRGLLLVLPMLTPMALPAISAAETPANLSETYGKVPLQFEENRAQADEAVRFLAHGPGYSLYLTSKDAVLVLAKTGKKAGDEPSEAVSVRMSVVGARSTAAVAGVDELPGKANYFIGNDPSRWRTNVPTYAKVRYSGVYPGIDLVYYGQQRQLEYDFVVAPGADPDQIALGFRGANDIEIDAHGDLLLHTAAGDLRQHKPVVYQEADGIRQGIEGAYVRKSTTQVAFKVAEYDRSRPLVIDPLLAYSSFIGGSDEDTASAVAIDADRNVYVTGLTFSGDFPTTPGALKSPGANMYVSKIDATGSTVVYSAYFGSGFPGGIAIDSDRNAYVTGNARSDFPTTPGAFQTTQNGHANAFVLKLDAAGSTLVYSTFLNSGFYAIGQGIALDANRDVYVTGYTTDGFPVTAGAFNTTFPGGPPQSNGRNPPIIDLATFVTKLDRSGSALVYSTYLGVSAGRGSTDPDDKPGETAGIAVDAAGEAYVVGTTGSPAFPTTAGAFKTELGNSQQAFVTKLNSAGSALVYSTFLGGSVSPVGASTSGAAIAIDTSGHAYVTGTTTALDFPVTPGAFQTQNAQTSREVLANYSEAFVTKLDPSGSSLVYSTYLGGTNADYGRGIAVDVDGNAFVTGYTFSSDFPLGDTCAPFHANADAFAVDAFVTMLDPKGATIVYSTYLGGSGTDLGEAIVVDAGSTAYVVGETGPPRLRVGPPPGSLCSGTQCTDDFPTTPTAFQPHYGGDFRDGFVVKISQPELPAPATPTTSAPVMPSATTSVAESGQSTGSGGGGAFDWLTLSALLAALGLARRRRAQR